MSYDAAQVSLPIKVSRSSHDQSRALCHHTLCRGVASPDAALFHTLIAHADLFIATLENDPDVILGFLLCDVTAGAVHYVYTKKSFRRFGIARQLFAHAFGAQKNPITFTLNISLRDATLFKRFKPRYQPLLLLRYACKE